MCRFQMDAIIPYAVRSNQNCTHKKAMIKIRSLLLMLERVWSGSNRLRRCAPFPCGVPVPLEGPIGTWYVPSPVRALQKLRVQSASANIHYDEQRSAQLCLERSFTPAHNPDRTRAAVRHGRRIRRPRTLGSRRPRRRRVCVRTEAAFAASTRQGPAANTATSRQASPSLCWALLRRGQSLTADTAAPRQGAATTYHDPLRGQGGAAGAASPSTTGIWV